MHLRVTDGLLLVELTFWEKLWGIHGSFRIPLSHVTGTREGMPPSSWKDLRMPGSFVPGLIKAGTYFTPRGKEFWSVTRGAKKYITIELMDERYKRLVLGLAEDALPPELTVIRQIS